MATSARSLRLPWCAAPLGRQWGVKVRGGQTLSLGGTNFLNEYRTVSVASVITTALWVAVVGLIAAMWASVAVSNQGASQGFGFTACATTGVASTASIRRYAARVLALIRATHGLDSSGAQIARDGGRAELHVVSESTL